MKNILLALLLLVTLNCSAADEWTRADINREIAYGALHAIDWLQTLQIPRHPNLAEGGLVARHVIGVRPTNSQINQYMAGSAVIQYAIARSLPREYRDVFQYITIVDSGASVLGNFRIGLNIKF